MSLGSDIFGYVAGAIGILVALYAILSSQLPQNQFKYLLEVLEDTESLFLRCTEEGLLDSEDLDLVSRMEGMLLRYRSTTEKLRTEALRSPLFTAQFSLMLEGLGASISRTALDVARLRGKILSKSDRERELQQKLGRLRNGEVRHSTAPPSQPDNNQHTNTGPATPPPSTNNKWTPRPPFIVKLHFENVIKLCSRLRRRLLRRSYTYPNLHLDGLFTANPVSENPENRTSNSHNGDTHVRATSGVWTANTLVAQPPTDESRPAATEETARRCSSPLPLPYCTPLKGSRARSRLHPIQALRSCGDAILKALRRRP
ncbi:hypothetical protein PLICRDRAFT_121551 [Plicaturopsis crispa FD-325 SS-3]|nr:hypothetical protein PLICRDRAFT_121551 [Plicaturopsis crispa FD-325 SS-3]